MFLVLSTANIARVSMGLKLKNSSASFSLLYRPARSNRKISEQMRIVIICFWPGKALNAGVNMKARFWLVIMALTQISRLRFKQSRIPMLISHIYVLGRFVNFLVIFRYIWR